MDKTALTPLQAWDEFYSEYTKPEGDPFPNELIVAEATRRGKQKQKGKAKNLGAARIARLLEKYAPGKYQFHEAHFTKQ